MNRLICFFKGHRWETGAWYMHGTRQTFCKRCLKVKEIGEKKDFFEIFAKCMAGMMVIFLAGCMLILFASFLGLIEV